jgi:hypothetical protein
MAVATGSEQMRHSICPIYAFSDNTSRFFSVSYLARTCGQVLGVSLSGAVTQSVLDSELKKRIVGKGAAEVSSVLSPPPPLQLRPGTESNTCSFSLPDHLEHPPLDRLHPTPSSPAPSRSDPILGRCTEDSLLHPGSARWVDLPLQPSARRDPTRRKGGGGGVAR